MIGGDVSFLSTSSLSCTLAEKITSLAFKKIWKKKKLFHQWWYMNYGNMNYDDMKYGDIELFGNS